MKRHVGIDVAQKGCALCIVDGTGAVLFEVTCVTDPEEIVRMIGSEVDEVAKIVYVSDPSSIWVTRALVKRGAPVVCIDARAAHKVLSARTNKSGKPDAVGLAQLAHTGLVWSRSY